MDTKRILFILSLVVNICCTSVYAFDDGDTHPRLTKKAIASSNLIGYLTANLGLNKGVDEIYSGQDRKNVTQKYSVMQWLQEGSTDEDHPLCRATNHFHNPIHTGDWTQSKMSDSVLVPIYSFIVNCGTKYSNVTWATGFTAPIAGYTARDGQVMGWDNARTYLFEALTSKEPAVREEKFVNTFKSVGMVVHLLQDVAVPAHVRNDMQSHLLNSLTNPSKWGSNPFEKYVSTHPSAISIDPNPFKPTFALPLKLTDFWDNNSYTGENPSAGTDQGLAEYANANFVSDFTIFKPQSDTKHYFKYPSQATSVGSAHYIIEDPIKPGQTIKRTYYQKINDGDDGYRLAGVGFLNRWSASLTPLKRIPPMDDNVHDDYAKKILPRAVGYSAALLDYFFRGKINLAVANPSDISFRSVKVNVQNNTAGETMDVGEVKLIIRYKALSEWNMGGNKYQLNYPPEDSSPDKYTYKVSIPQFVDLTNPQTLTFDFSTDTLPYFFDDMTMQLVFKGKLGNEEGAVAVSQLEPIIGVYSDFTVSLPASGVYAKAADGTLSATFNELKVTAQTDIPAGLTGGNFELALDYRKAATDPFQSLPVDTEPANAVAYVIRVPEKNGVSILQPGTPVELTFDLSSVLLPVSATDVYLNIIYKNSGTSKTMAVGLNDIAEPTPVDVYNTTDYTCLNSIWYRYGDPEAMAIVDSNNDGIADRSDIYPHTISNISFLSGPTDAGNLDASISSTLFAAGPLQTGQMLRMGYILTDYTNRFAISEARTGPGGDPWPNTTANNKIFPGSGFRNDGNSWSNMFTFRGSKTWWGEGVIFINKEYNGTCTWDALLAKFGL